MKSIPGIFGMTCFLAVSTLMTGNGRAQERRPVYHVDVNMVVLTFNVTDGNDQYVGGLKSGDFQILEDGIPQKTAIFAEGSQAPLQSSGAPGAPAGTSVFILFDTSDRMYQTYAHACDAVADFVRHLDPSDSVAIYNFSRNLWRAGPLTKDHAHARAALERMVAGDDTAVYDALLMTVRDAAKVPGRRAIVLFSNGPDTASMLSPSDVATVAEDEGIPIYVVSTNEASRDEFTRHAFEGMTAATGGKLYVAKDWRKQADAFVAIRKDIGSAYTLGYYPKPNPNQGFRHVEVKIGTEAGKKYRIRMRAGYVAGPQIAPNGE